MIFKQTWLNVADNTNVEWLQVFHLYKGFFRKQTSVGFFVKGSARIIQPPRVEYKGYKFRFNKKGDICRGLLTRQKFPLLRLDGTKICFNQNSTILIKKKQNPKSKYVLGPTTLLLRRKKFKSLHKIQL
jgi:large subunit ribosomal protein L14